MIRFASLVAQGAPSHRALLGYHALVSPTEAEAARALLSGQRPKRIASADTLLAWVAEATGTPAFLVEACLSATPDKAELASLLLPQVRGERPTLFECLSVLQANNAPLYLATASRLPPQARLIFNRLAAGTFRLTVAAQVQGPIVPGTCLAILTMIDPAGPFATFALPHGNALVPLTKLRMTLPETAEIVAWTRANTTDRFGPLRQVAPSLVFKIAYQGTTPNPRRKCGLDLIEPGLTVWARDLTPDCATPLSVLSGPFPLLTP